MWLLVYPVQFALDPFQARVTSFTLMGSICGECDEGQEVSCLCFFLCAHFHAK